MPRRKRKKVGWVTVTSPKHGTMRMPTIPSKAAREPEWAETPDQDCVPDAATVGAMHSGLSRTDSIHHMHISEFDYLDDATKRAIKNGLTLLGQERPWDHEAWGLALAGPPQNPMHPVHPAWGHRTHYPTYDIFET